MVTLGVCTTIIVGLFASKVFTQVSAPSELVVAALTVLTPEQEKERAAQIVGPVEFENNCSTCHALEHEAWQKTRHFTTFVDRHQDPRAKEIWTKMDLRSMKRGASDCRQCHYTSVASGSGEPTPKWGVSCESCHGGAKEWVNIHNKVGGNPSGNALKWGTAKDETPDQRLARLNAAKGMMNTTMIYDIATNCYNCHTVPNEKLVNVGTHKAGTEDFDLVAYSQGEIRHNFASSPGAPDKPTNDLASPEQRRRLYIIGAMVDLELSLRNIAAVKEKGGAFHKAMLTRVANSRKKLDAIFKAKDIPLLSAAVAKVPATVDESTAVSDDLSKALGEASREFVKTNDGKDLGAIDSLIPTTYKGTPYKK